IHALMKSFVGHPRSKRSVANDRNHFVRIVVTAKTFGDSNRRRNRSSGMAGAQQIMRALMASTKTRYSIFLAQCFKALEATSDHFVRIRLVPNIENNFIFWRTENPVQSEGQFHNSKRWTKMTAIARANFDEIIAIFSRELRHFFGWNFFQVFR